MTESTFARDFRKRDPARFERWQQRVAQKATPEQEAARLEIAYEQRVGKLIGESGLPKWLLTASFSMNEWGEPFEVHEHNREAYELALKFARFWAPGKKGLIPSSERCGVGKSWLMAAACLTICRRRSGDIPTSWRFVTAAKMMRDFRAANAVWRKEGPTETEVRQMYYEDPDILFIDDLGQDAIPEGSKGGLERRWVLDLVNHRKDAGKTIVATTNLDTTALEAHYGEQTVSRLLGMCLWTEIEGQDWRTKRGQSTRYDLDPF